MLTDDVAIELIKNAIKTEEGWNRLVLSLGNSVDSKNKCIELLKKIGTNKAVNVVDDGGYSTTMDLGDLLVAKLEKLTAHIK